MEPTKEALKRDYKPELAIIVYVGEGSGTEYYLESHPINPNGKMLEGRPLKAETLNRMIDAFKTQRREEATVSGIIPTCLLAYMPEKGGDYTIAWWRPAEQRNLIFRDDLKIPSGRAMVPPLLYVARKHSLSVWAMESSARPNNQTKFYRAPFHNVYDTGSVCLGSAKARKAEATFEDLIRYWEDMFWNSEFSHLNGASPLVEGENLNMVWREQIADPKRRFPHKVLQEAVKMNLQKFLKHGK